MKKILLIFLVIVFPCLVLFSQSNFDSLKGNLKSASGKERVQLLLTLADQYIENNNQEAISCLLESLNLSKGIKDSNGISNSSFKLGQIYFKKHAFVEALKYFEIALSNLSDSRNNSLYPSILSSVSEIYLTTGIYFKALDSYMDLFNYYKNNNDKKGEAYALSYIGKTYDYLNNGQNALKYLNQALEIAEEINDEERICFVLNSLGGVYVNIFKNNSTAESYYVKALDLSKKNNYSLGIAKAYHNLGLVYYNNKELNEALKFHKKSLEIVSQSNITEGLIYNYNSIAKIYLELNKVDSATQYFENSLKFAEKEKITLMISENYKGLSDCYKKLGNFSKALSYLELFNEINEKLLNEKLIQNTAELEIQYELKRKESENQILISSNSIQRNYFILVVVLLVLGGIGLQHRYYYLKKSRKQLEELNATKDKLFSIIGHDLKNPFSTLINFSEILMEDYLDLTDEEKITYLHMINEASQTGHEILDNLLQWSKTQSGKLEFVPQFLNLNDIVDANITLLNSVAASKGVKLLSEVNEEINIFADKLMLKTVLRNLIGNAIKFSNKGGTITISSEKNDKFMEVSISDTGIGMNEETMKKLFNPAEFYSTTGTANEQGTGLGLLLCKEFVEKNGGKIWVESREGNGSDFKFTVPVSQNS